MSEAELGCRMLNDIIQVVGLSSVPPKVLATSFWNNIIHSYQVNFADEIVDTIYYLEVGREIVDGPGYALPVVNRLKSWK